MIICGTGHRPPKLGGYTTDVFERLVELAEQYITEQCKAAIIDHDDHQFSIISGMALGWDMALAQACITTYCKWTAAIPFEGQQLEWPKASQSTWQFLVEQADKVEIISDGGYAAWKMHRRNEWMVNHSDKVVALYNGDPLGGTAACLHYAESQGKTVDNLWDKWMEMNDDSG